MGSISLNGTAHGESFIGGDMPAGPMTFGVFAKAGEDIKTVSGFLALLTGDFGGRPSYNCRASTNPDIRMGLFDQNQVGEVSSVSLNPQEWAYYAISSDGGANDLHWSIVRDAGGGAWTVENHVATLASLGMTNSDLTYIFLATIGGTLIQDPLLMTAIKVYARNLYTSGAGMGTDLIAQARTRATLWPSDLYAAWDWDGSTTLGLDVSDEGAHTLDTWVSTGVTTSTDQPSFPDDSVILGANAAIVGAVF